MNFSSTWAIFSKRKSILIKYHLPRVTCINWLDSKHMPPFLVENLLKLHQHKKWSVSKAKQQYKAGKGKGLYAKPTTPNLYPFIRQGNNYTRQHTSTPHLPLVYYSRNIKLKTEVPDLKHQISMQRTKRHQTRSASYTQQLTGQFCHDQITAIVYSILLGVRYLWGLP